MGGRTIALSVFLVYLPLLEDPYNLLNYTQFFDYNIMIHFGFAF